jgi:hypothetical protein
MTRRELKDAVVEAAREHTECKGGVQRMVKVDINLHRASHALDACTEPDLDALNAAVAEAVETYMVKWPHMDIKANCNEWTTIIEACRARRAALAVTAVANPGSAGIAEPTQEPEG